MLVFESAVTDNTVNRSTQRDRTCLAAASSTSFFLVSSLAIRLLRWPPWRDRLHTRTWRGWAFGTPLALQLCLVLPSCPRPGTRFSPCGHAGSAQCAAWAAVLTPSQPSALLVRCCNAN